jgi:hypothetical protein
MNQNANTTTYYREFVSLAKNGMVFAGDMSDTTGTVLSEYEVEVRDWWNVTQDALHAYYQLNAAMQINSAVTSVGMFLLQRLAPPRLDVVYTSRAAAFRLRHFPHSFYVWSGFEADVAAFVPLNPSPITPLLVAQFGKVFSDCIVPRARRINSEAGEVEWITDKLSSLESAGLAQVVRGSQGIVGYTDFTVRRSGDITIMCEAKATQSLRLPMDPEDTVRLYNEENVQVRNPLGQVLRGMIDNQVPFGALTSSTRTYFISICQIARRSVEFRVSKAWLVGEEHYLRAWTYVHSLGSAALDGDGKTIRIDWNLVQRMTTRNSANETLDLSSGSSAGNNARRGSSNASNAAGGVSRSRHLGADYCIPPNALDGVLPVVPWDDIEIKGMLGYGKNGTAFKAFWAGQEVALKQFDLSKGGEPRFQSEATSYFKLQEAWGKLVPRPFFLSESASGKVTFLGMQLGRDVTKADDLSWPRVEILCEKIHQRYGIRLLDVRGANFVFLPGEDGTEELAAIDLEDHEQVDFKV